MRRFLFIAFFMPSPVGAKQPWIDYELLFQQHADKVVEATGPDGTVNRKLRLGDGVLNLCKGAEGFDDCDSFDMINGGSDAGCQLEWLAYDIKVADLCDLGTAMQRRIVEGNLDLLGKYVAENAVPALDWPALRTEIMAPLTTDTELLCKSFRTSSNDPAILLTWHLRPDSLMELHRLTSKPRLPVNSCYDEPEQ